MALQWPLARDEHRMLAQKTNGAVWGLLSKADRTPAENDQMVWSAYASLFHWSQAGNALNLQRGHWLLSRVYAVVGDSVMALRHAEQCLALTHPAGADAAALGFRDFDYAYAEECLARALALGGNPAAKEHLAKAQALGTQIAGERDREIFQSDLVTPPILLPASALEVSV
ncbi:MAG: hypothetical protein ACM3XM_05255 [Mycobacterium leprae]